MIFSKSSHFYVIISMMITFSLMSISLYAFQVLDPDPSNEWFAGAVEALYGAVVIILGYLSPIIPGLNKIQKPVYRVFAIAIVLIIAFVSFGWAQVIPLLLTYATSTSLYELIFKLIKKTPETGAK